MSSSHTQPHANAVCPAGTALRRRLAGKQSRIFRLRGRLQKSQALLAQAQDRIRELEQARPPTAAGAKPTASNRSIASSANPIGAPRPVFKKTTTGRKRGRQAGHRGAGHKLLPVEKVDQVVRHRPGVCKHCLASLQENVRAEGGGTPSRWRKLPRVCVSWTEHQSHACRRNRRGKITRGMIPADIAAHTTGPRLTAAIGIRAAWIKGSRRAAAERVGQTLGCPVSLASIRAREAELGRALDRPHRQLLAAVREAPVKYVDETGWKSHGQNRGLFVAAGKTKAVFRIEKTRARPALPRLLDPGQGNICTDRYGIYHLWPPQRRQLCWAHLKRDFTAMAERGGAGQSPGEQLPRVTARVFASWRASRRRRISCRVLRRRMAPLRKQMREVLAAGAGCWQKKTAGLCQALLGREKALWRFIDTPALESTNNLAERMLRPAVIWRKKSFGSHSQAGCRYAERMPTVIQTPRLRGVNALDYLSAAVEAHRTDAT